MNKFLFLFLISTLVLSCSETTESKKEKTEEADPNIEENHHHHDEEETIQLNEGQKWKVDDSMLVYIRNMEKLILNFKGDKSAEFTILSDTLTKNISLLTSNCTVTGQAHDELHKWLIPFIAINSRLENASDITESGQIVNQMKESFEVFNTFFE